ncbi:M20/M25/M40 family metallo-hydrolase [Paludicola sp. MB14-C6]|uniref:M42 family metallopeptidase n=1 Tax=Paludihabitans sp. MB14-C6 TaxID=3070656 RepID=UPI0027DD5418|nr:M20/M25/M40 family metallo-hydrolase [Paludicola sp. MB14-C6]WMJ23879.1 M20/M25/M40 family metallo-hydrolase [Paludicola sp. MB14-C6]
MQEIKNNLKELCLSVGVVGLENIASQKAAEILKQYTDDVTIDYFGNVIGMIKSKKENAKTLLLDAHIDEIGMIVTSIDDKGFVKVASCGGMDRRLLAAQEVTIHGTNKDIIGIVGSKPPHLEKGEEATQVPEVDSIFIDIGYTKEQAEQYIALGDRVTINSTFQEMLNNRVSVKAMDDRSGVVSILEALRLLKGKELDVNLAILFSSQEEVGGTGARVGSYGISPDYAIAIDVSFAYTSDADEHKCGKMGKGVMIGVSALLDKKMSDDLVAIAKEKEINHQIEVITGRSTGTNADSILITKGGVKTAVLSIPEKYMHTPIEMVEVGDIEAVAQLIAEYAQKVGELDV